MPFVSTAAPSDAAYRMLELEEGVRYHAYKDSRGIWTIGVGHTMNAPYKFAFSPDDTWTQAIVDHVFRMDSSRFVQAANDDLLAVVNQHQFDALFILEYNIGMAGLRRSHIIDVINHHGPGEVRESDFLAWAHPSELKGRRMREWQLYSEGVYRTA